MGAAGTPSHDQQMPGVRVSSLHPSPPTRKPGLCRCCAWCLSCPGLFTNRWSSLVPSPVCLLPCAGTAGGRVVADKQWASSQSTSSRKQHWFPSPVKVGGCGVPQGDPKANWDSLERQAPGSRCGFSEVSGSKRCQEAEIEKGQGALGGLSFLPEAS